MNSIDERRRLAASQSATRTFLAALSASVVLAVWPSAAAALTSSYTFDTGAQGWTTINTDTCTDAMPQAPAHSTTGGNPGGHINDTDGDQVYGGVETCYWFALAPPTVSGNLRANYGGTASFDLRHPAGADFGGLIVFDDAQANTLVGEHTAPPPVGNTWTRYTFGLRETASAVNWTFANADGSVQRTATQADFFDVLSDVDVVALLGDLDDDAYFQTTQIDNFTLTEASPPLDSDSDGVNNAADQCPLVQGPISNNGCPAPPPPPPDGDGDGVPNASDACPTQAGPASNNGCPLAPPPPPAAKDTDPPETKLTKKPAKRTVSTRARFKFTSDEPDSMFECKLDKGEFKACTSPKRLKKLKPRRHTFSVRAIDAAANPDPTPAKWKWNSGEENER